MVKANHQLYETLRTATPKLERELGKRSPHELPDELQLRDSQCGLACAALQKYLEQRGVQSERMSHISDQDVLRGINSRRQTHVVLKTSEDMIIDPTYGQFMSYIGLTPRVAHQNQLTHLYPQSKIAVFQASEVGQFTADFSKYITQTWDQHSAEIPEPNAADPRHRALRGIGHQATQNIFRGLWDLSKYRPITDEDQPEGLVTAAKKIAEAMNDR